MPRPTKATVDYFPHYVAHGKTMFTFEGKYGNDGYAFWFKTLEILGSTEQHFLDYNDGCTMEFLLAKTRLSEVIVNEMLNMLAKIGAIDDELWKMKIIWSENFVNNLSSVYNRREVNVYGKPELLDYCIQKLYIKGVSVGINPQSKVKEVKYSKVKEVKKKKSVFEFEKTNNELLDKTLHNFSVMRSEIKKPLSDTAAVLLLKKLRTLSKNNESVMIEILENSIIGKWQGVFALKEEKQNNQGPPKRDNFEQRQYPEGFFESLAFNRKVE